MVSISEKFGAYTWNHTDPTQNHVKTEFIIQQGDILNFEHDPIKKTFKINRNYSNKSIDNIELNLNVPEDISENEEIP